MLILDRPKGTSFEIVASNGELIVVTILNAKGRVKVGVEAAKQVEICRSELREKGMEAA